MYTYLYVSYVLPVQHFFCVCRHGRMRVCMFVCAWVCVFVCVCVCVSEREKAFVRARENQTWRDRFYARTCAALTRIYRYEVCFCIHVCTYLYSVLCIFSLSVWGSFSKKSFRILTYIHLHVGVVSYSICPNLDLLLQIDSLSIPSCLILRLHECIRKQKKLTVPTLLFYITSIFV